jgi:5-methylthioribose kinase
MIELSVENAAAHLRAKGWLRPDEPAEVTFLGGGVSNIVLKVKTPRQSLVLKQALPKLRVEMDWRARIDRIWTERDALKLLGQILPDGQAPRVVYDDPENYLFAMTCAPDDARNWKDELMAGHIEPWVAGEAGRMLGRIHRHCQTDVAARKRFADNANFVELRTDPYFVTVGQRHPDLQPVVEAETRAVLETKWTLVHGDFSPKNMLLIQPPAAGRQHLLLLDCEVAHLGHPAFDAAFCLNHLCLKAVKFPERGTGYLDLAGRFWQAYRDEFATDRLDELSRRTVVQLGLLQLARVDGKSPAEYLTEPDKKEAVRRLGRELVSGRFARVEDVLAYIAAAA